MTRSLSEFTTLGVGGAANRLVVVEDERTLIEAIVECDKRGEPVLIIGGGSNLVISDDGFDGTVVLVRTRGVAHEVDTCSGVWLTVAAGEPWDDIVELAVGSEWTGIEALSGIPGSVGATPIQNVGAYGQQVGDVIAQVRTWDRHLNLQKTLSAAECEFEYRNSIFRRDLSRYVVLDVTMRLNLSATSAPVVYQDLVTHLGSSSGERHPLRQVRDGVLAVRRGKGMVLDPNDPDTRSTGSFFTNPILPPSVADQLPADAPRYPAGDGLVKTSAAWLIQHAGFDRGFGNDRAAISSKHTLALTNRGDANANDVLELAREIRNGVAAKFGVTLEAEPILVNCSL